MKGEAGEHGAGKAHFLSFGWKGRRGDGRRRKLLFASYVLFSLFANATLPFSCFQVRTTADAAGSPEQPTNDIGFFKEKNPYGWVS